MTSQMLLELLCYMQFIIGQRALLRIYGHLPSSMPVTFVTESDLLLVERLRKFCQTLPPHLRRIYHSTIHLVARHMF